MRKLLATTEARCVSSTRNEGARRSNPDQEHFRDRNYRVAAAMTVNILPHPLQCFVAEIFFRVYGFFHSYNTQWFTRLLVPTLSTKEVHSLLPDSPIASSETAVRTGLTDAPQPNHAAVRKL